MVVSAPPPKFPVQCPSCDAHAAFPFRATTGRSAPHTIELSVRCRQCAHEWQMSFIMAGLGGAPMTVAS